MNIVSTAGAGHRRELIDCEESLPANFARVVSAHGSRKAIGAGSWQPTYDELNIAANRVAHALLGRGGALGDRVAILMSHDGPLIGGIVAVHKAGRIAVVLNPSHPPSRLNALVEDADARLILTDRLHRELAAQACGSSCAIVQFEDHIAAGPSHDPEIRLPAEATAALVYTSGSTGRPKAIMQPHDQMADSVRRHSAIMSFVPDDRILFVGSPSGSQGYATIWCALLNGASLCPFPIVERGVSGLAGWMREHGANIFISSASIFRQFKKTLGDGERLPLVRVVRLASEPATSDDFRAFQDHFSDQCRFVHTLASSEVGNTCYMSLTSRDEVAEGRLPIGRPSPGLEIFLLDEQGRQVVPGEPGDIVVRGRYLSSGYWRNEALTAARFSNDPESGMRMFRSGDQARINADGQLEFRGRKDAQVKVRGFRIDLLDVEEALLGLPAVERAVVLPQVLPSSDTQLAAYLTMRKGQTASARTIRNALRALLPSQMIPQAFVFLEDFPLTSHGKVDREKLLQMPPLAGRRTAEAPQTETEALLADLWKEVFELPEIGRQDDFFELGGDSLKAAVVAARIYDALGAELNLGEFAEHPSLAALAAVIDEMRRVGNGDDRPPLVRVSRDKPLPLSFHQERIWKYSQTPGDNASYVMTRKHRIVGPLDVELLRQCMNYMVRRHEILRTTFPVVDGHPVQVMHPPVPVDLKVFDVSDAANPVQHAALLSRQELDRTFDLSRLPLLRFALFRIGECEHFLDRVSHHIIYDGWSWNIYFRELGQLYEVRVRGDAPPLPESEPLQYADYSAWQRDALRPDRPAYRAAVDWWKEVLRDRPRPLELPFKRRRPAADLDPELGTYTWEIPPNVSGRLDELGRVETATSFMVRLAAFVALLAMSTGERDVIVGSYLSNRNRVVLQNMFGFFANLATLRFRFDRGQTFREWLSKVRGTVTAAEAHGDVPCEELFKELLAQDVTVPEIRVIFNMFTDHLAVRFADLELTFGDRREQTMPWGFTIRIDPRNRSNGCLANFDAGIYDPVGVREFVERYKQLLDLVAREPDRPIGEMLANWDSAR